MIRADHKKKGKRKYTNQVRGGPTRHANTTTHPTRLHFCVVEGVRCDPQKEQGAYLSSCRYTRLMFMCFQNEVMCCLTVDKFQIIVLFNKARRKKKYTKGTGI